MIGLSEERMKQLVELSVVPDFAEGVEGIRIEHLNVTIKPLLGDGEDEEYYRGFASAMDYILWVALNIDIPNRFLVPFYSELTARSCKKYFQHKK